MGSVMDQDRDGLFDHKGPPTAPAPHPDDSGVDRFAVAMKAKLSLKRREGRRGWNRKDECSAEDLSRMLREHVAKGDPVDVANFCMMLHQRGERICEPTAQPLVDPEDAEFLGEHVIDMADRLRDVDAAIPGAQATYSFEDDGMVFKLTMTVTKRPA